MVERFAFTIAFGVDLWHLCTDFLIPLLLTDDVFCRTYSCMRVCTSVRACMCVCVCTCVYVCAYDACVCVCVSMYVRMHACVYVCTRFLRPTRIMHFICRVAAGKLSYLTCIPYPRNCSSATTVSRIGAQLHW